MKKLILWSRLSGVSKLIKKITELKSDIRIIGLWIDNEEMLGRKNIEGIPVYSFDSVLNQSREGKIDGVLLSALKASHLLGDSIFDRARRLRSVGIDSIYVIPATLERMPKCEMTEENKEDFVVRLEEFSEPLQIKFLASEKCNLNCSGCSHFAPLIESPKMLTVEECKRDLLQLKRIFKYIKIIQFLGGEPLLNKQLPELIEEAHRAFPYAYIAVITNGLLIPSLDQRTFDMMRKYNVQVLITLYPPTIQCADEIQKKLEENQIGYSLSGEIREFRLQYNTLGNKNMVDNYYTCPDGMCHTIVNGKIANCYYAVTVKHANKYFNVDIPFENSIYDLYDTQYTGAELLKKITSPSPMCCYCNSFPSPMTPWKRMKKEAKLEEWFWDDESI